MYGEKFIAFSVKRLAGIGIDMENAISIVFCYFHYFTNFSCRGILLCGHPYILREIRNKLMR